MNRQQSSYRQIVKGTTIFGGVQVFQIIIQVLRSKFIAILLGPSGMGIAGLLTSTIALLTDLTNFGLGISAVKSIAEANSKGNNSRIAMVVIVLRRLVWITGLLGAILTLVLATWLSQLTFGNHNYSTAFRWLSVSLLFNQISSGQMVLLQGLRKLKYLANANLTGSVLGLLIALPMYFYWGINGIVPAMVATSLASMLRSWYFASKVRIEKLSVSAKMTYSEGKEMLTMGIVLSLSGFMATGASYILRIYLSNMGSVSVVGLYSAGFVIINTYVGLIFTAMATDFYPRLSSVAHNNTLSKQMINNQAEIAVLILAPILIIFLVFIRWGIIILYSNRFIAIDEMLHWAILGIFFKAPSWAMAFLILAKGKPKYFFINELISNINMLLFNIIGFHFMGLPGLGVAFSAGYMIYLIQIYAFSKIKYQFCFSIRFIRIFAIQFLLATSCFFVIKYVAFPIFNIIGIFIIATSIYYSYKELDRRISLKQIIAKYRTKAFKK